MYLDQAENQLDLCTQRSHVEIKDSFRLWISICNFNLILVTLHKMGFENFDGSHSPKMMMKIIEDNLFLAIFL